MSTPFFAKNNIYEFCVSYLAPQEHMLKSLNGFWGFRITFKTNISIDWKYGKYIIIIVAKQLDFFDVSGTMDMYTVYVCR